LGHPSVRVWLPRYPTVGPLLDRSPRFSDASCRHTQPFACRAALGLPFKWSLLAQALRVLDVSCSLGEPRYLSTALDAHFPPQRRCREAAEFGTIESAHSALDVGPATLTAAPLLWLQQAEKITICGDLALGQLAECPPWIETALQRLPGVRSRPTVPHCRHRAHARLQRILRSPSSFATSRIWPSRSSAPW